MKMSNIENVFYHRQAFISYVTAGYLGEQMTQETAIALAEGGVDILEVGIPFSDPVADGPVIQQAMADALQRNTDFTAALSMITAIKKHTNIPIVLFGYYNPLLARGLANSLTEAASAGVDGVLVVDLPLEESDNYLDSCNAAGLDPIYLISPSTPEARIKRISEYCRGFLYYVCRNGTTGIRNTIPEDYQQRISTIKTLCDQPVATGFGISTREMAAEALSCADGFVVASRFVKAMAEGASPETIRQLASSIDPRN